MMTKELFYDKIQGIVPSEEKEAADELYDMLSVGYDGDGPAMAIDALADVAANFPEEVVKAVYAHLAKGTLNTFELMAAANLVQEGVSQEEIARRAYIGELMV